jgi:hypothetical protein
MEPRAEIDGCDNVGVQIEGNRKHNCVISTAGLGNVVRYRRAGTAVTVGLLPTKRTAPTLRQRSTREKVPGTFSFILLPCADTFSPCGEKIPRFPPRRTVVMSCCAQWASGLRHAMVTR